jgi:hypothetical protein
MNGCQALNIAVAHRGLNHGLKRHQYLMALKSYYFMACPIHLKQLQDIVENGIVTFSHRLGLKITGPNDAQQNYN